MRKPVLGTVQWQLIVIASSLLLLASPLSSVQAQDEEEEEAEAEEGGDIDQMMEADPDRPAEAEGEAEGEGEGEDDGERPPGGGSDDERPPGEAEESEDTSDAPVAPVDDGISRGFRIGALAGYGLSLEDGPNVWSAGFGLQGVYDTGMFVVGARFVYYIGGSAEETVFNNFGEPSTVDVTANVWELGLDIGVDLQLSPAAALRPGLGLGFANASVGDASKLYGAVSPGLALIYDFTESFYVGLDARFQIVTAQPEAQKGIIFLAAFGGRV
jgi:hypothetical protein